MKPAMLDEWHAWRSLCRYFEDAVGESINARRFELLVMAIRRWGEELVSLRLSQRPLEIANALHESRRDSEIHPQVRVR